jgi:PAS domain S-box-containing protein
MKAHSSVEFLFRSKTAKTVTEIHILLIQANPDDPILNQRELNEIPGLRFKVVPVETPEEAAMEISRGNFDMVFIDMDLPGKQAMEIFHQLRANASSLPFILLAGSAGTSSALEILQEGAQDCLFKSQMEMPLLLRTISNAIESRQYRKRLQEMTNFYKAFIDNSLEMFAVLDLEGEILFVNSSFGKVLGRPPHELAGRAFFSLIESDERDDLRKNLRKAAGSPEGTWIVGRFPDAKCSLHILEGEVKRFLIDEKEPRLLVSLRDVTHFMRLGEIFEEYKLELQEAEKTIHTQSRQLRQKQDDEDSDRLSLYDLADLVIPD